MATYVIPCGFAKGDTAALARDLYIGSLFRHTLAAVEAAAQPGDLILILSALHGLVELDTVLAPYEQRMDRPGRVAAATITAQAARLGVGGEVYAFLPGTYFRALDEALRPLYVWAQDVYEATAGNGEQRHVNAVAARGN